MNLQQQRKQQRKHIAIIGRQSRVASDALFACFFFFFCALSRLTNVRLRCARHPQRHNRDEEPKKKKTDERIAA